MTTAARRRAGSILGLVVLAGAGCSDRSGPDESARVTIREENGVTLVDNPGPWVADSAVWAIDPEPGLSIGSLEGPAAYLFGRVVGVAELPGDRIVVADGQTMQLRLFDEAGAPLGTVGRQGEGPGEFYEMSDVARVTGDSVLVLNRHGLRVHLLDPDLEFVRRVRPQLTGHRSEGPPRPGTSGSLAGSFGDGDLLMVDYYGNCGRESAGPCTDSAAFYRTDLEGRVVADFGTHAWDTTVRGRVENGPNFRWSWPHPQPMWATSGERFYYVDGRRREILVHGPGGGLERVIRIRGFEPAAAAPEMYFPDRSATISDGLDPASYREMLRAMRSSPLPDTLAAFVDFTVDAEGWIWLREYALPRSEEEPRWWVLDGEGRLRHVVTAPATLASWWSSVRLVPPPLIGSERILAVVTDDLGVERVVGYRLERNR